MISPETVADMLAHAREDAPRECCGLLIGKGDSVVRSMRAKNLETQDTRYLIDPKDHFRAIRDARAEGLDVIGAYHSHPTSAPIPSATDITQANSGADFLYVIVSLIGDDVRAYRMERGTFTPYPLPLLSNRRREA